MNVPTVVGEGKGNPRPCYGNTLELFHYVTEFHGVALEEFPAGGDIVKQVPYAEVAALRRCNLPDTLYLRPGNDHLRANGIAFPACTEGNLGHGGYRGKGLTPETECKYVMQSSALWSLEVA